MAQALSPRPPLRVVPMTPEVAGRAKKVDDAVHGLNEQDAAAVLASGLLGAFGWDQTSEGYEYWSEVYDRLCNLKMK